MKRKTARRIWLAILIIILSFVLFFPIKSQYKDGGTIVYHALTYKVIKWHGMNPYDNSREGSYITGTEVHVFPFSCRDLDHYWEKKLEKMEATP